VKIAHALIGTTKLVVKYFLEKIVSFANQKVGMKVTVDYYISSYKCDNQGSIWNKIRIISH
jgi:hypothetical protein